MTSRTEVEARPRALVVGTGLIGGSIALALRRRGWHVTGTDADEERLEEACASGVIDAVGDDPEAQVVFIATPAAAVAAEARRILDTPGRRGDAVVTDVSGVKTAIVEAADHPRFIGGHAGRRPRSVRRRRLGPDPDRVD
jgi:prephenate dehydrogenase